MSDLMNETHSELNIISSSSFPFFNLNINIMNLIIFKILDNKHSKASK